jgi:hypothetical protein
MGRTYSLNGFLNATLRRSSKTVLVEGPSDKHALHRIELEKFPSNAGSSAIDHAGMLDDPLVSGLGNKAKVLAVQAHAVNLAATTPKISNVLATLVDREWDGITFLNCVPNPTWSPPTQSNNNFVTTGHSLENYHFDSECVIDFLKYTFPEHTSTQLIARINGHFSAVLVFATMFSLHARNSGCIGRCAD